MISRYSRPEMSGIWQDGSRYLAWLRVEQAVCEELAAEGRIPARDWAELKRKLAKLVGEGGVDPARVEHHEAVTRHDVIAFTTAVAERIGPLSRYVHFGLTSSDVVDTALSLLIQEAGALLRKGVESLQEALRKQALRYRDLPAIGRTHGMFAEPTSFGLKFLGWHCELRRCAERLDRALEGLRVGKLSGAVGSSPHWGPGFEARALARLGLRREEVSTQVIPRDRHAELFNSLALCGTALERVALELRHLQRSEVGEVMESFGKGQKGSSAMPHKRNPISSENLTGCARLLRSYAQAAMENVALWHERDISHSSVERVALPDATILLDYALARMTGIVSQLVVREERVRANLEAAGPSVFSGHVLLALVEAGASREDAYASVQECALAALEGEGEFAELLGRHPGVSGMLERSRIRELVSLRHQLRNVDEIFAEALGSRPKRPGPARRGKGR